MAAFVGRMASRGIGLGKALFTTGPGLATLATAGVGSIALQSQFGTGKDFFHHKFTTTKNADKIVDFYSTEEFLQILGIFNFATNFVLAGVVWATDTDQKNTVWNMRLGLGLGLGFGRASSNPNPNPNRELGR